MITPVPKGFSQCYGAGVRYRRKADGQYVNAAMEPVELVDGLWVPLMPVPVPVPVPEPEPDPVDDIELRVFDEFVDLLTENETDVSLAKQRVATWAVDAGLDRPDLRSHLPDIVSKVRTELQLLAAAKE